MQKTAKGEVKRMANFIEELYFRNIDPQACGIYKSNDQVQNVAASIDELEQKLINQLQNPEKQMILDLTNGYSELMGNINLDSFINGFRIGVKFTYDTFVGTEMPFVKY